MRFLPQPANTQLTRSRALVAALLLAASSLAEPIAQDKAPAPKPAPDVILFTNGDQLSGTLERGVGNSVVFKSDMAGEITVPLDKVKELHSSGSFAVLRKDVPVSRKTITPGTVIYADKKLTVATPLAAHETIPADKIAYIIDQPTYDKELEKKPGPWYGWNGTVNGGATVVRATDYGETFTAGIALVRAIPSVPFLPARNRTTFDLQETYGKLTTPVIPQTTPPSPPQIAITSIFHADAERDEYFSPAFFALAQTSFDHNYSQGLNLQQVYGGGIGWTAIKTAKQQLDIKADLHYEKQTFQTPVSQPRPDRLHHLRGLPPHPAAQAPVHPVAQHAARVEQQQRLLGQRLRRAGAARLQAPLPYGHHHRQLPQRPRRRLQQKQLPVHHCDLVRAEVEKYDHGWHG